MDKFTWFFVSKMVKVQFVSLVNLILGKESSKELLQDRYTKENLIYELNNLLLNEKIQKKQIEDLKEFNSIMNQDIDDPSENATRIIKKMLKN